MTPSTRERTEAEFEDMFLNTPFDTPDYRVLHKEKAKSFLFSTLSDTFKELKVEIGEDEDIKDNILKIMPEKYWRQTGINQERQRIHKLLDKYLENVNSKK